MTLFILVAVLAVGDLLLAYYLWRERQRHQLTRSALRFWRREAGLR